MRGLFVFILIFFGTARAENSYLSQYTTDEKSDDGINYEQLVQGIQQTQAQTLEQALDLIPSSFYQNYVLMYRSRSLQDANPLFPRVIVFGRTAQFIMAFNGHEKQKGFNQLEIIQFRQPTNRWEFREITFFNDKPPTFSEANPTKCLECHQSPRRANVDPRPNWEPYNFWPGAYASVDSTIDPVLKRDYERYVSGQSTQLYEPLSRFLPQDRILIDEQALEKENLKKFEEKIKPTHERYRHLTEFNLRSPLSFTKATTILNMRRVARLLRQDLGDLFDIYKYALFGLGHYDSPSSSTMLKYSCGQLAMTSSSLRQHLQYTLSANPLREDTYLRPAKAIRWRVQLSAGLEILLHPLGIQTEDWSMDFKTGGRFSVSDRFTSPHDSHAHFRDAISLYFAKDPAVRLDCNELKEASEKSLMQFEKNGGLLSVLNQQDSHVAPPARPLIQRCISCHVNYEDGGQAPQIPFDDFSRLRPLLQQNKYPRGTLFDEILYRTSDHAPLRQQMPPSGIVHREERDRFMDSLRQLL